VVNVFATVRDKKGQILNNLNQDDFSLTKDGRPQTIRYFSREMDLPLTLGLLVDTSGSERRVIGEERDASHRFLDDVLGPDKDQAFVLHFDREVELLQDLTNSLDKLHKACELLEVNSGSRGGGGGYPGGGGGGAIPAGDVGEDTDAVAGRICTTPFTWRPTMPPITRAMDVSIPFRFGARRRIELPAMLFWSTWYSAFGYHSVISPFGNATLTCALKACEL
jgi:hypothetical protein